MNVPAELKYVKSHEWIQDLGGGRVRVGITDFAQHAMGDIVFVNLPEAGQSVTAGERLCDIESVKSVEDVFSPVTGTVCAVNEALRDAPETVNADPYGAWFAEIEGVTATEDTLDAAAYAQLCEAEA